MNRNASLKIVSCALFTLLAATVSVAQSYKNAEFLKSPTGAKKGEYVKGTLNFNTGAKQVTFQNQSGSPEVTIPFSQIKHLLYERTSKPRYVQAILISPWFILSHSKKHYLTIQYEDAPNSGRYALLHLDKSNYQELLATAEAATGKTVERTEER